MVKQTILTTEGLERLKTELEKLTTVERKEIAEKLKVARGYGDLSENSEYDEAKNEQARVEARIMELEAALTNYKIVEKSELSSDKVIIGSKLLILDVDFKEESEIIIVSSSEADPSNGRISDESPIGKALLGKKEGQTVDADTPAGILKFKIVKIFDQ